MKKSRILSLLLMLLLLLHMAVPAFATEAETTEPATTEPATINPSITAPVVQGVEDENAPTSPPTGFEIPNALAEYSFPCKFEVRAKAAVLVELNTHAIIYSYEMDQKLYPASLTKIMTCMLALENGNLDDLLTVTSSALSGLDIHGSTAGLLEGERLSLREVLYCVMVSSANEACNVVAEYLAGSTERFVEMMNQKASQLGMRSTHFANAHGLHNDDHYTTARDLATLACWAWQNPQFRQIASTTEHTIPATNLSEERHLVTTNQLTLDRDGNDYYYSKARGIKTGFTTPAGGCLISTAISDDVSFLSVVCGCSTVLDNDGKEIDRRFTETKRLMEYAFEHYTLVQVLSTTAMLGQAEVKNAEGRSNVVVHAKESATVLLPEDCTPESITMNIKYDRPGALVAPLEEGQKVGTVTAMYENIPLATTDLVTLTAVAEAKPAPVLEKVRTSTAVLQKLLHFWYLTIPALVLLLFIVVLFILRSVNIRKAKKRAERRRAAARRRQQR